MGIWISGGKCKGPEAEVSLVCWRSSKEAFVAGLSKQRGEERGVGSSHEVSVGILERYNGDLLS